MSNDNRLIVFDLDGVVFTDFFIRDRENIRRIFKNNKIVMFIDKIARILNSSSLIKNTTSILNIRLFVYSLFINKSFHQIEREYRSWYLNEALESITENSYLLNRLKESGYDVVILSNNLYSSELDGKYEIITAKSKSYELKELYKKYNGMIEFIIGDNYFDDIVNGDILDIKTIYLGKSIYVRKSRKTFHSVNSLKEAIGYILNFEEL